MVFPAPAGINRLAKENRARIDGVPRASGDKPKLIDYINKYYGVFPAPAGINRVLMSFHKSALCVPRASGDKPIEIDLPDINEQCSPRQRG